MTDKTPAPRYEGTVTYQFNGKSFVRCDRFNEPVRFFTIDAEGVAVVGSRVEFDIDPDSADHRYAINITVIAQPDITVHLNADATLSPKTAAALDALIHLAIDAMESDSVVEDDADTDDMPAEDSAIVAAELGVEGAPSVLVGERAKEIACACGKTFWAMDSDHVECDDCDSAAAADEVDTLFEGMIEEITTGWTETRAILTRDPETGVITVQADESLPDEDDYDPSELRGVSAVPVPLTAEQKGLLELAEGIADGIERGDIVLLSDAETEMLDKVTRFDGLVLMNPSREELFAATRLVFKGKVRMEGIEGGVIVSAVRDGEGG